MHPSLLTRSLVHKFYSYFLFLANDVLLSHMITFLNDKEDKHLRGSFFDCIVGVAAYVGCHASPIIFPLLQQVTFLANALFKISKYLICHFCIHD